MACHPKRAHQSGVPPNKVFKGVASWGKTSTGWLYGIKIHLIINNLGEIIQTFFTTTSTSDTHISVLFYLLKDLSAWVFGDKGYVMNQEKMDFVEYGGTLDFLQNLAIIPKSQTKNSCLMRLKNG